MILMDLPIVKNLCNQIKAVFICETSFICIKSGIGKKKIRLRNAVAGWSIAPGIGQRFEAGIVKSLRGFPISDA